MKTSSVGKIFRVSSVQNMNEPAVTEFAPISYEDSYNMIINTLNLIDIMKPLVVRITKYHN
jgi:hypothetical protein